MSATAWPLRRVVAKRQIAGDPLDFEETLECGHVIWPSGWTYKPAKRRRCSDCAREIRTGKRKA